MKFFHLSDLHIGLRLMEYDMMPDQRYVFDQIVKAALAEKPDAIVIAGDVYNKANPAPEAVELYNYFINALACAVPNAAIMIIAGNHDEALRIDLYGNLLARQNIYVVGTPPKTPEDYIRQVSLNDEFGKVNFWLLPFVSPAKVQSVFENTLDEDARLTYDGAVRGLLAREDINTHERNVIVSHQFYVPIGKDPDDVEQMDSENIRVGGVGAIGADALAAFDYAALGHLHKPMNVGEQHLRYCGTPLQYSVSEAGQQKGIVVVEMGKKGSVKTRTIPLLPLHEIRKLEGSAEELLSQASDDYVALVVTDTAPDILADFGNRARVAFPNLLKVTYQSEDESLLDLPTEKHMQDTTPMELCLEFLGDITDAERDVLQEVINEAVRTANEAD